MRSKPSLTASDAARMMAACKAAAARHQWAVCIAIVDDGGYLLALERLDGAHLATPEAATGKARTAALMRKPSRFMEERVNDRPAFLRFPYIMPVIGGVPVMHEGECVGGIGVAGVQSDEDEQVAQAGADALAGA
jgi:glc operon protein GlcG